MPGLVSSLDGTPNIRSFDDIGAAREAIVNQSAKALSSFQPLEHGGYKLELSDVKPGKSNDSTYASHKKAMMLRGTLGVPMWGTWTLSKDGNVIDKQKKLLATVPIMTNHGTFVRRGIEYTLANQMRLRSGIYTHEKENGELESHFNVAPGTGKQFKLTMSPDTGRLYMTIGQSSQPIIPILRAVGVTDDQMKEAWGEDIFNANQEKLRADVVQKAVERLGTPNELKEEIAPEEKIKKILAKTVLDPEITERTLGKQFTTVTPEAMLASTKKLIGLHRGEAEPDNRDDLSNQIILGPEDLIAERLKRSSEGMRRALWRAAKDNNLNAMPTGVFNEAINGAFLNSGLGQPVEETNVMEVHDQLFRISRLGQGAIANVDAIPDEARVVQGSFASFIDPIRSPESEKVGVDNRFSYSVRKGDDGKVYRKMLNTKSGKLEDVSSDAMYKYVVGFPGEPDEEDRVAAIVKGKMARVDKDSVDYIIPAGQDMFTPQSNLMPGISSISGGRVFLGSKFIAQALPLKNREAPLVQTEAPEGLTFENIYGKRVGAIPAKRDGTVVSVGRNVVRVRGTDGKIDSYELADYLPHNRRTFLKHKTEVTAGQKVQAGDVLASSNITDKDGTLAIGTNMRVAYMPFSREGGTNYEDAVMLSETGAKKLESMEMYMKKLSHRDGEIGKAKFRSVFPGEFTKEQLDMLDDDGVIKPGTQVNYGDPLVLAVQSRGPVKIGMGHKGSERRYSNRSVTWDHESPGIITDAAMGRTGVNVAVASVNPIHVGDKVSGRAGDKGVVAAILPDEMMPTTLDGKLPDIIVNPLGIISRSNPAQLAEAAYGKVAEKIGHPVSMPAFSKGKLVELAKDLLKHHGLTATEVMHDPVLDINIPNITTGNRFYYRLHHLAEKKLSGRGSDANYTSEGAPGKGGSESAPRFGLMEVNALISGGATNVLEDARTIRGQRNVDYWRAVQLGYTPPTPKPSTMTDKFFASLLSAGINVKQKGNQLHLLAATDADVDAKAHGEVTKAGTVSIPDLKPVDGGLFDRGITGGHGGTNFAKIELGARIPNPVMEDPIRKLLRLTEKEFRGIMAGSEELDGKTGPEAIESALKAINVKTQLKEESELIPRAKATPRDQAIKRMRILEMLDKTGLKPTDMMISKMLVLPPTYRPISMMNDVPLVNPVNTLYKDLLEAKTNYHSLAGELGHKGAGNEYLAMYDAAKAVTGLGDPISQEAQTRGLTGLLKTIFGTSPKYGMFQRKLMGTTVDLGGRAVISPNPRLDMDQVGLPENVLWKSFRPFIMRRLVRSGMTPLEAAQAMKTEAPVAKKAMMDELDERPVLINRAPSLHRFSIMGAWAVPTQSKTMQISPLVTSSFNADFDGDTMAFHVPSSEAARKEVIAKMMPSKQLFDLNRFKVHHLPRNEFQLGLFLATKEQPKALASSKKFDNIQEVVSLFKQGKLSLNDVIDVPAKNGEHVAVRELLKGLV